MSKKEKLIENIARLKKEKNAIILAHYYQVAEVQDIADFVGDSLVLAQWAAKTTADIIVLCGYISWGNREDIEPRERVFMPDMEAGCSLADSCPADHSKRLLMPIPIIPSSRT